jgi:transcriptional regulator of acetoin/glycerol metabolism
MTLSRQIPKHVKPDDVDAIYCALNKAKKSMTQLSRDLGISRTTLHLMFKHEIGMRKVYALAIKQVLQT